MTLRDSLDLIRMARPEAGTAAIDSEIMAERASSLGEAERQVIAAITALESGTGFRDTALLKAQKAVWGYFVQRELCGFRSHRDVIQELRIPAEVLAGLGSSRSLAK